MEDENESSASIIDKFVVDPSSTNTCRMPSKHNDDDDEEVLPKLDYSNGPVVPECEISLEGDTIWRATFDACQKNPGHTGFIPVKDITFDHLPSELQSRPGFMDQLHRLCNRTIRAVVRYTSHSRPDFFPGTDSPYPYSNLKGSKRVRRFATASLNTNLKPREGPCPCPLCRESDSGKMRYWSSFALTASHAVYDDLEAAHTLFDCFYDDESRDEVVTLYGVNPSVIPSTVIDGNERNTYSQRYPTDYTFVFCVTHDKTAAERVNKTWDYFLPRHTERIGHCLALVSHPHGGPKMISFGKFRGRLTPTVKEVFQSEYGYLREVRGVLNCFFAAVHLDDFGIPSGSRIEPPRLLCESDLVTNSDGEIVSVIFPPETYVSASGTFRTETEMCVPIDSVSLSNACFLTYDTPTCPGTSGAIIFLDFEVMLNPVHSGSTCGINRSGLHYCAYW